MPHEDNIQHATSIDYDVMKDTSKKRFTKNQVKAIIEFIIERSVSIENNSGTVLKPKQGTLTLAAEKFGKTPQNMWKVWEKAKANKRSRDCHTASPGKKIPP